MMGKGTRSVPAHHEEQAVEYHIDMAGATPDLGAIEDVLYGSDPAVIVAMARDGFTLRIATYLPMTDLLGLLQQAGSRVDLCQVVELPSICCGGCGG
jgi:hypothetical protein